MSRSSHAIPSPWMSEKVNWRVFLIGRSNDKTLLVNHCSAALLNVRTKYFIFVLSYSFTLCNPFLWGKIMYSLGKEMTMPFGPEFHVGFMSHHRCFLFCVVILLVLSLISILIIFCFLCFVKGTYYNLLSIGLTNILTKNKLGRKGLISSFRL